MTIIKDILSQLVTLITELHDRIWDYNLSLSSSFTDKQLHFFFFGLFGLLLLLLVWPLFRWLARRGCAGTMAWLFTLSTVLMVSFAVEVGQSLTKTGNVELEDIVSGVSGFLAVSAVIALVYWLIRLLKGLFREK